MTLYHLALTVPMVMLFAGLEWSISKLMGRTVYQWKDSILNLSCGLMERGLALAYLGAMYLIFELIHQHAAFWDIPTSSPVSWAMAIILLDFLYYWHHRISHTVNLYWAAHVTHHSSGEFNFTVSFRNSIFPMFLKTITFSLMPLLGFPVEMILLAMAVNGIYQFFLHTRLVGTLGILEWFLVTPSAHRVHHGCNEKYLDRNFGAVLIIWDRLFGTYQAEEEEPDFGLAHPIQTQSPVWAYLHYLNDLLRISRNVKGMRNKIKWWFADPEKTWKTFSDLLAESPQNQPGTSPGWRLIVYQLIQLGALVVVLFYGYLYKEFLSVGGKLLLAFWFVWSSTSLSMLLTGRPAVIRLEKLRLLLFLLLLIPFANQLTWLAPALLTFILFSSYLLIRHVRSLHLLKARTR